MYNSDVVANALVRRIRKRAKKGMSCSINHFAGSTLMQIARCTLVLLMLLGAMPAQADTTNEWRLRIMYGGLTTDQLFEEARKPEADSSIDASARLGHLYARGALALTRPQQGPWSCWIRLVLHVMRSPFTI